MERSTGAGISCVMRIVRARELFRNAFRRRLADVLFEIGVQPRRFSDRLSRLQANRSRDGPSGSFGFHRLQFLLVSPQASEQLHSEDLSGSSTTFFSWGGFLYAMTRITTHRQVRGVPLQFLYRLLADSWQQWVITQQRSPDFCFFLCWES